MPGSKPGERRGGRPKGGRNKFTGTLKDMILKALDGAGGADYLQEQAETSPAAFMALLGKVLPLQITGKDGKDLTVKIVDYRNADVPK